MSPLISQSILMLADSTAPQLPTGFNSETQKAFSGSAVAIFAGLAVLAVGVIWAVFFAMWFRDNPKDNPKVNAAELALLLGIKQPTVPERLAAARERLRVVA